MDKETISAVYTLVQYSPIALVAGVAAVAYLATRNSNEDTAHGKHLDNSLD